MITAMSPPLMRKQRYILYPQLNQNVRERKGEKYPLQVNVKMLQRWMSDFLHFNPQRVSDALAQIQQIERKT